MPAANQGGGISGGSAGIDSSVFQIPIPAKFGPVERFSQSEGAEYHDVGASQALPQGTPSPFVGHKRKRGESLVAAPDFNLSLMESGPRKSTPAGFQQL